MPTNTTNFNLIKPIQGEFYNVDVPNSNMDTIDGVLKALQEAINSGASEQELAELQLAFADHLTEKATVNEVGHVQLSNLYNGTSSSRAVTEKALNDLRLFFSGLGIGSNAFGYPNDTDLDTTTANGLYRIGFNTPQKGIPAGTYNMLVINNSNAIITQMLIGVNAGNQNTLFTRTKSSGVWAPTTRYLNDSMVNAPNGVLGLDASGNVPASLGVDAYKLVYSIDFATNPLASLDITNLGGYKKLKVLAKGLNSPDPQIRNLALYLNGVMINSQNIYPGTQLVNTQIGSSASVIPGRNVGGVTPYYLDFVIDIESELNSYPRYRSSLQDTQASGSVYHTFGIFNQTAVPTKNILNSVHLFLQNSVGVERLRAGTLEVWGVAR